MNAFYELACALVAWSALSLTAPAAAMDSLAAMPTDAFSFSVEHPGRFGYLNPGADLSRYRGVLIEPLATLGKEQGDWTLKVVDADHPLERNFHLALADALAARGVPVTDEPAPGVLRLRLALTVGERAHPQLAAQSAFNLEQLAHGVDRYMQQVLAVGQIEDAMDGTLLGGSAELRTTAGRIVPAETADLASLVAAWSESSAQRLALALGRA